MNKDKVLLGFSGGIDSSYASGLLRAEGYEVTALYMDMYGDRAQAARAQERAASLGVDFRPADIRGRFRRSVVDYFISEYLAGRTPAPCTVCNHAVKWAVLRETALAGGYTHIATGHYFNVEKRNGKFYVSTAADPVKDQSYYLWMLDQQTLSMTLTPMGGQIKNEIKRSFCASGAACVSGVEGMAGVQKESMGVCFLEGRNYTGFLREECGGGISRGEIVDREGRVVGSHDGTPYYTIGQKRGLGLPSGSCVTGIDAAANRLIAGTDKDLYHRTLILSGCKIVDMDEALTADDITVMIRGIGRNPQGFCKISRHRRGLRITLDDPAWAAAAGQPVVLYRNGCVIGGGFLDEYF